MKNFRHVTDVSNLSGGLLLSATDDEFILTDLRSNAILYCWPLSDFISEFCKYPSEVFANIAKKIFINCDNIFYDNQTRKIIDEICETNCLLY